MPCSAFAIISQTTQSTNPQATRSKYCQQLVVLKQKVTLKSIHIATRANLKGTGIKTPVACSYYDWEINIECYVQANMAQKTNKIVSS